MSIASSTLAHLLLRFKPFAGSLDGGGEEV
jgi:hypothetical protein